LTRILQPGTLNSELGTNSSPQMNTDGHRFKNQKPETRKKLSLTTEAAEEEKEWEHECHK